ncbi:MAG: ActS/PrrB/RegB family redox-sensitive histidine kinase [Stellaceae bacterium]
MSDTAKPFAPAAALGTDVSVSLRRLVFIRWVAIGGQAAAVVFAGIIMGFRLPIWPVLAVIATSAALNLATWLSRHGSARLGDREASLYLGYDMIQLGLLLYLTGGLQNPFAILMLAPVTVAATILSLRSVIGLSALTVVAISLLAVFHLPLPWYEPAPEPSLLYVLGVWTALILGALFVAYYVWSVAAEARRMRDAFAATQLALAREQRISAVGGLAAAAAHQLGSPLATIAVIAKELVRDLPKASPHAEDAALLLSQSERCRDILADLAQHRESEVPRLMPFSALVELASEPYRAGASQHGVTVIRTNAAARGPDGAPVPEPMVPPGAEIMHGLGNLIQNATQFAVREATITVSWSEDSAAIDIVDDGPGFPQQVLARIGEPYLSGRTFETESHMGLGIFIAQTLLERTGARLSFANLAEGGAQIVVEWRRGVLEGTEPVAPLSLEVEA